MSKAYLLTWDRMHLEAMDDAVDMVLEHRADDSEVPTWPEGTDVPVMKGETVFGASFGSVKFTHYPVNDMDWPVMSRRMLHTLLSAGTFPHVAHPVAIVDPLSYREEDTLATGPEWYEDRLPAADREYVLIQLTEHLDLLDQDRSDLSRSSLSDTVTVFSYVLKEGHALPPLFRTSVGSSALMISAEARQALAEAGIAGPAFLDLSGEGQEEVDVPVPEPVLPEGV